MNTTAFGDSENIEGDCILGVGVDVSMRWIIGVVAAVCCLLHTTSWSEDPALKRLDDVIEDYQKTEQHAIEILLQAFELETDKIREGRSRFSAGMSAADRIHFARVMQAERKSFIQSRTLPLSIALRQHTSQYLFKITTVRHKVLSAYDRAADMKLRSGEDTKSEQLIEKAREILDPKRAFCFQYQIAPGEVVKNWVLFDNGKLIMPNGKPSWSISGNLLTMKGEVGRTLKDGIWTDRLIISNDGLSISGKNHVNHQNSGFRNDLGLPVISEHERGLGAKYPF